MSPKEITYWYDRPIKWFVDTLEIKTEKRIKRINIAEE